MEMGWKGLSKEQKDGNTPTCAVGALGWLLYPQYKWPRPPHRVWLGSCCVQLRAAGPRGHGDTYGAPQLPPGHLLLCPCSGLCFTHSGELRCWVGVAAPRSCAIPRAPGCVRGDFGPKAFPFPQQSGFPPPAKGTMWEALAAGNPSPEPVRLCPLLLSCQDPPGSSRLAAQPPALLGAEAKAFYWDEGKG